MTELVFLVEESPEGGFAARALGVDIFTEADSPESLREHVRAAVTCHFDPGAAPALIRLPFVRDELIAV